MCYIEGNSLTVEFDFVSHVILVREDEQAAPTGLRTPVWSTRHIIPVGLTVVLDVALVQDQTAPLGATK